MRILASNVHVDGVKQPEADFEILLHYVADLVICVDGEPVFTEQEFPLVEFASQVAGWLEAGAQTDFDYDSMDSAAIGLVYFRRGTGTDWHIGSVVSDDFASKAIAHQELEDAVQEFLKFVALTFAAAGVDVSRFIRA